MSGVDCLICAATREELETIGLEDARVLEAGRLWRMREPGLVVAAVTGVGVPLTMARLLPLLDRHRPALLVNTGLAGAYPGSGFAVGDVVIGTSEVFADLGMELPDGEGFRPLGEFPFAADQEGSPRVPLPLAVPEWAGAGAGLRAGLKRGRGATVNACAGTDATGALRRRLFGADFESMEGAAVALAGSGRGIPVVEIRAVSNMAARRDVRPENVRFALDALRAFWARHGAGNGRRLTGSAA